MLGTRVFAVMVIALLLVPVAGATTTTSAGTNATTTTTANATGTTTSKSVGIASSNVTHELSDVTKITRWRYEDGQFHITLQMDLPYGIEVTDNGALVSQLRDGEGARVVDVDAESQTFNPGPGTTTIRVDADRVDGSAAVKVSAPGGTALLRTGSVGVGSPFAGDSPTVGWVGGASIAVLMALLAAGWVLRTEQSEPKVANR